MPIEFDGPNSKVSANVIQAQSGSTITIQSGHSLSGSGSGLTALNATQLTSGTIPIARIADDAITNAKMADDAIGVAQLSATGTASNSVFLRGDNTWAAAGGGKVLQVVSYQTASVAQTSSTSFVNTNSYGAITPTLATSKVWVVFDTGINYFDTGSATCRHMVTVFRGSTDLGAIGNDGVGYGIFGHYTHGVTYNDLGWQGGCNILDSPNTTSATTYRVKHRTDNSSATVRLQYYGKSTLTLIEIGA